MEYSAACSFVCDVDMSSIIRGLSCFVQPPLVWSLPGRPSSPRLSGRSTLPRSVVQLKPLHPQDNVWDFEAKSLGFQTVAGPSIPASDFQQALRSVARGEGKKWWGTEKRRQVYITITPSHFSLTDKKTKRIDFIEDLSEIPQLQVSMEDSSIFGFIRFNKEWGSMQLSVFRIAESHTSGYLVKAAYFKACTMQDSAARVRDMGHLQDTRDACNVAENDPETSEVPSSCTDQPIDLKPTPIRQNLLRRLWTKTRIQKVRRTPRQPLKTAKKKLDSFVRQFSFNRIFDHTAAPPGDRDVERPPSPEPIRGNWPSSLGQPPLSDEEMVHDKGEDGECDESDKEEDEEQLRKENYEDDSEEEERYQEANEMYRYHSSNWKILPSASEFDEEDDYKWRRRKYQLRKMRSKQSYRDVARSRSKLGTCAPLPAYLSNPSPFVTGRAQLVPISNPSPPSLPHFGPKPPTPPPHPPLLLTPSSLMSLPTPSFSAVNKTRELNQSSAA